MKIYKAKNNEIVDEEGKQVAIVVPVCCSMKAARLMASFAAQQMNHEERQKSRKALRTLIFQGRGDR